MPKEIPIWLMEKEDYARLRATVSQPNLSLGGVCVAVVFDWLERLYNENAAFHLAFAEQELGPLIDQQVAYRAVAMNSGNLDSALIEYGASRQFTLSRTQTGDIVRGSGEMDELPQLSDETAYIFCISEGSIGTRIGHAAALYKDARGIFVRDQNVGQVSVPDETVLHKRYDDVMRGHWSEVSRQREQSKRDPNAKVTLPEYRDWYLFAVRPNLATP